MDLNPACVPIHLYLKPVQLTLWDHREQLHEVATEPFAPPWPQGLMSLLISDLKSELLCNVIV